MAIETLLREKEQVLLSIEGGAGSGKTTLSCTLFQKFGGAVHHMDNFFLPIPLRTPERLRQPGGNVHYERFYEEVIKGIKSQRAFSYGVFDCGEGRVTHEKTVAPQKLHIIEGVYSAHPCFGDVYDLRVFLSVSKEEQAARIRARNGEKAEMFFSRWIPMENQYFEFYNVQEKSDIVL